MSWMGKILGGGLGFLMGGPLGAVLGAAAGHAALDSGSQTSGLFSKLENKQSIYFTATFSMLGKLAKADGVVTQQEVAAIDRVMRENLRLTPPARDLAIKIFNAAKNSNEGFEDYAQQFYTEFGSSKQVLSSIIDLLLLVGHADGELVAAEEAMILEAVRIFRLEDHYQQLKGRFTGVPEDINRYYMILGAERGDSLAAIKKKYRRLAMEFHPDRMQAEGVSPELASAGEDKFKEIQNAMDLVEKDIKSV
ncbi:MAG: DnaJ like chaperone protein [Sulfitobacter sp.]|jgi:DnaJ like chaperone protein